MTTHPTDVLGAHALGALDTDEAREVQAHLATCASCQAEYERLATLPGLLSLASPQPAAIPKAPPAELEQRVLAALDTPARRPRRRRRSRTGRPWTIAAAGAAAGAVLTVGALAATGTLGGGSGKDPSVTVRLTGARAAATAVLRPESYGTRVNLTVKQLAPSHAGEVYELWFVNAAGRTSAGTFTTDRDGPVRVALTAAARADRYRRIGITREPNGLDPARNGPNVLAGALPG